MGQAVWMRLTVAVPALLLAVATACSTHSAPLLAAPVSGSRSAAAGPTATASASPGELSGPRWFAVLNHGRVRWHDSATGRSLGMWGGAAYVTVTAIASWHDDHSVVLAGRRRDVTRCATFVHRESVEAVNGMAVSEVAGLRAIPGEVEDLAVSADHHTLALAVRVTLARGKPCGTGDQQAQLWVIDIATHARRVWTLTVDHPAPADDPPSRQFIADLNWAPDGRRLVLDVGACCASSGAATILDTGAQPGPLEPLLQEVPQPPSGCLGPPFLWTAKGLLYDDCNAAQLQFLDPATGLVQGVLAPNDENVSALSIDTTGRHVLAYAGQAVVRIDDGKVRRLMALPWDSEEPPSAVW